MNGKSIWAVVAGVLFIVIARLAPGKPVKHALILGGGGVLGLVGVALTWNQNLGPRWYAMALAVLAIPQCWIGGKIFES